MIDRACSTYGERRGAYRVLMGKPEGRRPLRRPRHKWEDNIRMDFEEWNGRHGLDRSGSGYGQVASSCKCGNKP
jgi:hypothetical protein